MVVPVVVVVVLNRVVLVAVDAVVLLAVSRFEWPQTLIEILSHALTWQERKHMLRNGKSISRYRDGWRIVGRLGEKRSAVR